MKVIQLIVFLTLSLLFTSCAQNGLQSLEVRLEEDGYRRLTAAEIKDALADNTYNATVAGMTFYLYLKSDGTLVGKRIMSSGKESQLSGTWLVSEISNTFCNQFDTYEPGSDCDLVYLKGDEIAFVEHNGRESSRGVIEQGNSRRL